MSVISLFEELHWISILQKTDMLVGKVCKHNVYIPHENIPEKPKIEDKIKTTRSYIQI